MEFCRDSGDRVTHNTVAPNMQNARCDERSAWDVMNSLDDFSECHISNLQTAHVG